MSLILSERRCFFIVCFTFRFCCGKITTYHITFEYLTIYLLLGEQYLGKRCSLLFSVVGK